MNIRTLAGALAATVVALGIGTSAPASATDNIKIFGEQARLNDSAGRPIIGYTAGELAPSNAPIPHRGTLYSAGLIIENFGGFFPPGIERFGARAQDGAFYPVILGPSNGSRLYFDVVGPVPNSVVWNDGFRDIIAWVPGTVSLEGKPVNMPPPEPGLDSSTVIPGGVAESDPALIATPNVIPNNDQPLTQAIVAEPGFNAR